MASATEGVGCAYDTTWPWHRPKHGRHHWADACLSQRSNLAEIGGILVIIGQFVGRCQPEVAQHRPMLAEAGAISAATIGGYRSKFDRDRPELAQHRPTLAETGSILVVEGRRSDFDRNLPKVCRHRAKSVGIGRNRQELNRHRLIFAERSGVI